MHQMSSLNKRLGSSIKSARASHQGGTGGGQGGKEENPRALQQWAFLLQSVFQRTQCKAELAGLRASILSGSKPDRFQTQSPLLGGPPTHSDMKDLEQFKQTERPRLLCGLWPASPYLLLKSNDQIQVTFLCFLQDKEGVRRADMVRNCAYHKHIPPGSPEESLLDLLSSQMD